MLAAGRGDLPHVKIDAGVPINEGYSHSHTKSRDLIGPQPCGEHVVDCGDRSGESNANRIERLVVGCRLGCRGHSASATGG